MTHERLARPLTPDLVRAIGLPWWSHFSRARLRAALEEGTAVAWFIPATREYLVVADWRHRQEIARITELAARRGRQPLLDAAVADLRERGCGLLLVDGAELPRGADWYRTNGFDVVDRIVTLELRGPAWGQYTHVWTANRQSEPASSGRRVHVSAPFPGAPALRSCGPDGGDRVALSPWIPGDLDEVLAVDHAAFPWLWWNSAEEFRQYVASGEVELLVGRWGRQVVGYIGWTRRGRWGHIDRLAVAPRCQGAGLGAQLLNAALAQLSAAGAHRVALTTQHDNERAQRLYSRFGFRPTGDSETLVGRWLRDQ